MATIPWHCLTLKNIGKSWDRTTHNLGDLGQYTILLACHMILLTTAIISGWEVKRSQLPSISAFSDWRASPTAQWFRARHPTRPFWPRSARWLGQYYTECVNSSVSRFGQKLLWKFSWLVQPGKKKIAIGTSTKNCYQTMRRSYWRTLYLKDFDNIQLSLRYTFSETI